MGVTSVSKLPDTVGSCPLGVLKPDPVHPTEPEYPGETHDCPCSCEKSFTMVGCEDFKKVDVGDICLQDQGRVIQLEGSIPNVCPSKRIALAVCLFEVDRKGKEQPRGVRVLTVPAHHGPGCKTVKVRCVTFVVPEDQDCPRTGSERPGCCDERCEEKHFKVRCIAQALDSNIRCCDSPT